MKKLLLLFVIPLSLCAQHGSVAGKEQARWKAQASRVTIIRDTWGIPHVYARSDADAVFGLLYAQCEDDFKRVEMNYIDKLGRMAEVKGDASLASDLYTRLVIDSSEAIADYRRSPAWLRKLLNAYADGINYYLSTHPAVRPALLERFEPWYPLLWTDGSIDAISTGTVTRREVGELYLPDVPSFSSVLSDDTMMEERLTGSNGFAVAPSKTQSGNAILYINPHVTFYFRPEVHVVSREGLNAYGAVTWGQFFIYQGFNSHCGWMHTSSFVDVSDMYRERVTERNHKFFYAYGHSQRPVRERTITLRSKSGDSLRTWTVRTYATHHGPVMARRNGEWISVRSYNRSLASLIQSWQRTRSTGFASFKKTMELRANTSNNTVFADDRGTIAYWHGNFVPRRDTAFNWAEPVDGTTPKTEWKGLHRLDELVHLYRPESGWIQNCNSTPFTASGQSSPVRSRYPAYMAPDGENFRAINAARVLSREHSFTLEKMIEAGYDPTLSAFELLVPALVHAYESTARTTGDTLSPQLIEAIDTLKHWNFRTGTNSVAATVALEWGRKLLPSILNVPIGSGNADIVAKTRRFASSAPLAAFALPLRDALDELTGQFGTWKMPWGEINRYQRLTGALDERFDDGKPSLPVGFASSQWGMLASFNSRTADGTRKRYGFGGSSFVCAVEFGTRLRAKSLLTGGESGDPHSKHFSDQARMYTTGEFKDVLFYKEDVVKHAERTYHPGE
ncbi:MAG: penicillin acylase family protein [Acidobacteriota bacterium]